MGQHTIDEIHSQPDIWRRTLEMMRGAAGPLAQLDGYGQRAPVLFTGCGSSYYLALSAAAAWSRFAGVPGMALSATDVMMYPECHFSAPMQGTVVAISRSGKTIETRDAIGHLKQKLAWQAIGISCNAGSAIVGECDAAVILDDAAEKSRFTTRAFTTTLLTALLWAARRGLLELEEELRQAPDLAARLIERYEIDARELARSGKFDQYIYLGQGPYFGLASEAMLKTKEMACTPAEAYHSLEIMHGPRYAAGASTLIVVLLSDGGRKWQLELLPKLKGFGAQVLVICEQAAPEVREHSDWVWELRSGLSDYGRMLLVMPLVQLFAYYRALALGKTID
jgi:glucosamine--fructose-6-phosphate aminotransferase (isomerizing)